MVKLEETRIEVKMPARRVSRSVPAGGQGPMVLARMVKKAAKRPLKNISSDPSQIMTPMASIGGRSWVIFPWGAGTSAETAWVTDEFLVDRAATTPTREGSGIRLPAGAPKAQVSATRPGGARRAARRAAASVW